MIRLLCVAAVLVGSQGADGQQEVRWGNKFFVNQNPPPDVVTHDFGTVPQGTVLTHKFPITNIYAVPMQVTEVRQSCGCVSASPSKQVLQPRETGTLDLTMDARKFVGEKTVTVYVTFGPKFISTAVLQIHANSRADVTLNPGQIDFGIVAQGAGASRTVDVTYTGVFDWRLTGVADNGAPVDVKVQELARRRGQISYRIFATLNQDAPPGNLAEELVLRTNDPASPQLRIRLTGRIQAPITVSPSPVNFGTVKVGSRESRAVLVRGSRPFQILRVEGDGDGIEVDLPSVSNRAHPIRIHFQPSKPGNYRRQVKFITDLADGASPVVTIEAMAE